MRAKQLWEEYAAKVLPKNAGEGQRIQTEQAFYAGMFAAFQTVKLISDLPDEDAASDSLEAFHKEIGQRIGEMVLASLMRNPGQFGLGGR